MRFEIEKDVRYTLEIDGLRVYLIKYNLFPRNRDPHNSPIRIEELKELVKHWKLHRQRGFWRDHPDKDDLVRALLQHIRGEAASKKRRQEAQEKYRNKTLAGGNSDADAKRDFSMIFGGSGGSDESENSECGREADATGSAKKKKNGGGDLFYQRGDCDEGTIYLSRIDRSKFDSEDRNPRMELLTTSASAPMPLDQLVRMGNDNGSISASGSGCSGGPGGLGGNSNGLLEKSKAAASNFYQMLELSNNTTQNTNLLAKEMKLKCVEGLYSISCHKGIEMQVINEGALATIISALKMDDVAIRLFAAATLLNLTATQPPTNAHKSSSGNLVALSLIGKEVYSKLIDEGVIGALLEFSHTPNATVKALCARALFWFTVDESHHFRMVHEGSVVALTQLMTSVPSEDVKEVYMNGVVNLADIPRAVTCDSILTTLIALAKSGRPELLTVCGRALLNLSILPTTRSSMVEGGAVVALSVLASQKQPVLFETISCVLCNLAAIKTNQELLVKNGALVILMDLLDGVQMEFERVSEEDGNEDDDGDRQGGGSTSNPSLDSAREEAVAAATMLLTRIRKNCVNVVPHLCCNPKLQSRVVNAAFVPRVLHILHEFSTHDRPHVDEDTEKCCKIAIANLSLDDRCRPNIVHDGAAPVLLSLLQNAERQDVNSMLLKLDCVTALSNLMLHPKNFKRMVDGGVVPAFVESINNSASPEIQKAWCDPDDARVCVQAFKNAELCGVCIGFLHHLSTWHENYDVLYFEGAVGLLVRVLQKPSSSEPVPVIYSLWLICMTTLTNLASHAAKRASLIGDGVIEAIQHFLSVSASDSQRRDVSTDTKIVKTQFAASQILFKLHELCCSTKEEVPAFFASMLLLATQSALKNSRLEKKAVTIQQMTASRCALAISKVSLMSRGLRLLSGNTNIPPALDIIMRTGSHEAQVCAAIALCDLATERGHLKHRLWRDSAIDDFIVITLLRVNSEQTKAICAKALFNLLTHEDTRDQMVKDGVLYALIKLARIENEEIQDLSLRSIYNISLHPIKALQLLEMEIVRILSKMYQAEFSKEIKRLMCGILSNLSSVPGGHEPRILQEGALSVLKNLAKVRDPETKVYAANILYNLSCCTDVAEALVRDEAGVLGILAAQLKSENKDVKRYGAASIANLSINTLAVTLMTEDALVVVLNDAMKKMMATCVATTSSCVFALCNLFSLIQNQKKFVECNGIPTLAAILACPEMESEEQTLRVSADMLCALASFENGGSVIEERLVRDGIIRALLTIVKGSESGVQSTSDENAMSMNTITSLSNLSKNPKCHELMLRDGALDIIALLCRTNPGDPRAPFKGLVAVRGEEFCYHCTVVLRNLSRQDRESPAVVAPAGDAASKTESTAVANSNANDVKNQRIGSQAGLVQIVLMLSQSNMSETREHVVFTIYNLASNKRCRMQLIKHDGVKVLLRLGTSPTATPIKRHVCSLALQSLSKTDPADDPHVANIIQPGIVTAIAALADQHQHDVLTSAASCLNAIVIANTFAGGASSSSTNTGKSGRENMRLLASGNQAIPQKGSPPDWAKVNISSMASWSELESMVESASGSHRHDSSHQQRDEIDKDVQGDSYSDGSDSDDAKPKESAGNKSTSASLSLALSSTIGSPKIGVRVAVKTVSGTSTSVGSGAVTAPRVCNADVVLGSLELLVDAKMDKVKVNVETELALRRSAAAGGSDELPKLRPATAPEQPDTVGFGEDGDKPRKRSTLTQIRHDATNSNGRSSSSSSSVSAGGSVTSNSPGHRSLSTVSPLPSPLKSPATPKRRSRILEPLATNPSSSLP
ncbi:hypothetical protein FI667_g6753, partial [Globisporangium splendens]